MAIAPTASSSTISGTFSPLVGHSLGQRPKGSWAFHCEVLPDSNATFTVLNRYQNLQQIGIGAQGIVWYSYFTDLFAFIIYFTDLFAFIIYYTFIS